MSTGAGLAPQLPLPMGDDPIVVKSPSLMRGRFPDMTLKEMQLLLLGISLIPPDHPVKEMISVSFPRSYLNLVYGGANLTIAQLKAIADALQARKIEVLFQDGWSSKNIVTGTSMVGGVLSLDFNIVYNEHLLELSSAARYRLKAVAKLSTFFQIRLYEVLLVAADKGMATFSLDEIKGFSGLEGMYADFRGLKRRLLNPAVEAINEHTDLRIAYEELRAGRAVASLRFNIVRKDVIEVDVDDQSRDAMRAEIAALGCFSADVVERLAGQFRWGIEDLRCALEQAKVYIDDGLAAGKNRNVPGVYRTAITQCWSADGPLAGRAAESPGAPRQGKSAPKRGSKRTTPSPDESPSHASHKPGLVSMMEPPLEDSRAITVEAMLERLNAGGDLYVRFVELAKRRGVLEHIDRVGLRQAAYVAPVRNAIWDFAQQEAGSSAA